LRRQRADTVRIDNPATFSMPQSERQKPFVVVRDDGPEVEKLRGAVVAIGNFDGVHRGHRSVIDLAMKRAAAAGKPSAVLTLEPHPRSYFRPDVPLFRLTDERQKLRLLVATPLDGAVVLSFNAVLAGLPAEQFVADILVGQLGVSGVAIGFDFHFGQGRGGSPAFLTEAGERYGFPVDVAPKLEDEGRPVSSGTIRTALEAGRVVEAAELLGYPWFASGEVVHGEKRGREMGFPTANLRLAPACGLKHGIYAVRVGIGDARYDGVASFGRRPTFDNGAPLLEVFLFGFSGDLYGQVIDVALIGWIRAEEKFTSIDALMAQMNLDAERARDALARNPGAFPPLGQI
jgi:riboflavin kinase/FMN adenylyltransferase